MQRQNYLRRPATLFTRIPSDEGLRARLGRLQRANCKAREAPKSHMESLGGSRKSFGQPRRLDRLQRAGWTAREAPESHSGTLGGCREACRRPERLQRAIWTCGPKTISDPITGFRVIKYLL